MRRKHITAVLLIFFCVVFSVFTYFYNNSKNILKVYSPVKIGIDLNKNRIVDADEIVCVDNIETFSLDPSDEFTAKYTKKFNLTREDIISLGYLAQEFAQKRIENSTAKLKYSEKQNTECKYADVSINGFDYSQILAMSGFGIVNGEIANPDKFRKNLETARKLHLVILNHRSGKYHTLDCPYGKIAHDTVIVPKRQLPANAKPCKFCHNAGNKRKSGNVKINDLYKSSVPNIPRPDMNITKGSIRVYLTDFTHQLYPVRECKTSACREFVHLVDNAKESIDIAIFGYDEIPAVTEALQRAKSRNVKIRFVYDEKYNTADSYYKDNVKIAALAQSTGSDRNPDSKNLSNMLMHNKFIIFDKSIVYTGSMNFSPTGISGYDVNDVIILNSKEIAGLYTKEFEQMLGGKFHTAKEKLTEDRIFNINGSVVEVYFSPKDKTTDRIVQILNNAKHYIFMPVFLITNSKIADAMIAAKSRGVDVRVIIDANSVFTRNSKHSHLRKSGVMLKTENYAGKLHSKMIVVDDEYLITGSMNFSNSGENRNDENLLIIKDKKISKLHKDFFLYLWTMIPNKYLKRNAHPESRDSIGSCSDGVDNNFNGKIDKAEALCK